MKFSVVIPARFASTRLPGKPLLDIGGKPMIQHVYERALESGAERVVIATDEPKIESVAKAFGAQVCMTAAHHRSGTERLSEVVQLLALGADEIVVNLQGDEPLMPPQLVRQVAQNLGSHPLAAVATLAESIHSATELFDPNVVKVVSDEQGYALYFSRAPIPWNRDAFALTTAELPEETHYLRHIGLYAYRAGFINEYISWPVCPLESIESLEQLRVLWHGHKIHLAVAQVASVAGVDTARDLERVRQLLQ